MHTFPSMEEVAIWIELEGVAGTGGCCRGLLAAGEALADAEVRAGEALGSIVRRLTPSGFPDGKGGGNGDIEIAVMEAEWAR